MKTAFVGTKIVTSGITNPVQLNRGEIAFFSSTGVLISAGTGLTIDCPIVAYRGLGNGKIDVGATLYKNRLSKTSAAAVKGTAKTFSWTKGVIDFNNAAHFIIIMKDPYMSTNIPREYRVDLYKGADETNEVFMARFKDAILKKVVDIKKVIDPKYTFTVEVTINAGTAPAPTTLDITLTVDPILLASGKVEGIKFESYNTLGGTLEQNQGYQVAIIEKEMAVHRGYNKELQVDKGGVIPEYFTTDKNKSYKLYCLATMTESPDSLANEDGKGYTVEQLIFLDDSSVANITAADTFIGSF